MTGESSLKRQEVKHKELGIPAQNELLWKQGEKCWEGLNKTHPAEVDSFIQTTDAIYIRYNKAFPSSLRNLAKRQRPFYTKKEATTLEKEEEDILRR
jgi:hypothetical protein